jgi:hypothetical protein
LLTSAVAVICQHSIPPMRAQRCSDELQKVHLVDVAKGRDKERSCSTEGAKYGLPDLLLGNLAMNSSTHLMKTKRLS